MTKTTRTPLLSVGLALALGLTLGVVLAPGRAPVLLAAGGSDRWGDSAATTGTITVRYLDALKIPLKQDAVYFLDYKTGRLLATLPGIQKAAGSATKVLGTFAERDLAADFRLGPGSSPHFLLTVGSLGNYDDLSEPLYVFETTTSQVAVYRLQPQARGQSTMPRFDLLELTSFARTSPLPSLAP